MDTHRCTHNHHTPCSNCPRTRRCSFGGRKAYQLISAHILGFLKPSNLWSPNWVFVVGVSYIHNTKNDLNVLNVGNDRVSNRCVAMVIFHRYVPLSCRYDTTLPTNVYTGYKANRTKYTQTQTNPRRSWRMEEDTWSTVRKFQAHTSTLHPQ